MLEKLNASRLGGADLYDWDELVQEDRVHRLIYTDPAIFAAEMTNIFGAVWVYLGHESQIPANDDFITVRLGLRPIILLRDSNGKIRALFNRCAHRGTTLCRKDRGSARIFTCPYHGWSYLNTGKLRAVPWPDGYACDFKEAKFNVAQVPRVDSYRGFIFATLNLDAPPLLDYLGGIRKPNDKWLDRQPKGRIAVCEANRLKFKGNWKLAYDNSGDGYHVVFSHRSLLEMENRQADVANKGMSYYKGSPDSKAMYMAYMGNGHHLKDKRPNIEKRAGGLCAVDEVNALRMRTQEQFPNFGEVDDLANFEEIQRGLACQEDEWIYMHRGLGIPGRVKTDENGIITAPATDEVFMREYIKEWKRLMKATPKLVVQREP